MITAPVSIAERLAGGPSQGLGPANQIAAEALQSQDILRELISAVQDKRNVVTTRAANALRKVQTAKPELLLPHAAALLRAAGKCVDTRTRWNLTNVVGSLPLQGKQKALAVDLLFEALRGESGFLRTFALTGLVHFAGDDADLLRRVRPILLQAIEDPSAAMRARARKLQKLIG